jgi:hypothetical protein
LKKYFTVILHFKMTDSILRRLALVKSVFGDLVINEIEIPSGKYRHSDIDKLKEDIKRLEYKRHPKFNKISTRKKSGPKDHYLDKSRY